MATELKLNQDQENTSLGGPASSAPGPAGSSPQARPQGATPSGRPNVQQYLKANQGAGQQLQQGIESNFNKQVDQSKRDLQAQREAVANKANPLEQNLGEQGSQKIQTSFKDPQSLLNQQGQLDQSNQGVQDWQKYQSGGYQSDINTLGTDAAEQQRKLQAQVGGLAQNAQNAGTEAGRFDLLRNSFNQPNYSRGQQKLDQLFLQAQPGVSRQLQQNLTQATAPVTQDVTSFGTDTDAKIAALSGLSKARQDQIKNLVSSGSDTNGLETDMSQRGLQDIDASSQARLAEAQQRATGAQGIQDRLANRQLNQSDLGSLGFGKDGQSLYGVDLSQFLSGVNNNPTLTGAADPAEFARYRALQQLSGDTTGDIFGGATQAGGYNPYQFNATGAQQAIDAARTNLEDTRFQQARTAIANNPWTNQQQANQLRGQAGGAQNADELQNMINQFVTNMGGGTPGSANFDNEFNYYTSQLSPSTQQYFKDLMAGRNNTLSVRPDDLEHPMSVT